MDKIPTQKLPPWIRWPLRTIFLPFLHIDTLAKKMAKILIPPPYKRAGTCLRRGECCKTILIKKARGPLDKLSLFWNTEVLGFYIKDDKTAEVDGKSMYVAGCRYLQKDGSCKHYAYRPQVCREWPVIEHFGVPRIMKGCGYKIVMRNKKDIR